jgi:predicted  nucleic acid-binding Zn-ribbon protein
MSNDSLKGFYGDQALSPHEAEHETPLNKPLTKSFEIQTSQSVNRGNVNRNFQKRMSVTGHIDQLKRTIESNFKECQQQLMDKMCKMYDEIHKNWKDESQKIVEEHKEEQQQIQEKIQHLKEEVQQLKEEVQQLKEQHNHLIESDPMSTVVKVS